MPLDLVKLWALGLVLPVCAGHVIQPGESLAGCLARPGPVTCLLAAGTHRGLGPLRPGVRLVGQGPATVITGTEPVPDRWVRHAGAIWRTELPAGLRSQFSQLFVGQTWLPEARWPNMQLGSGPADVPGGPLSLDSWARTANGTQLRDGVIVDPRLPEMNTTGALATLNVGFRFLTWTRPVLGHGAGQFSYDPRDSQYGHVGGKGAYMEQATENLYFLSGKLDLLDSPGEWFVDTESWTLYLWAPDSQPPGDRVAVMVRDFCIDSGSGPVHVANLSLHSCTFRLRNCTACSVSEVQLLHPTFQREIRHRDVVPGPPASATLIEGDHNTITKVHLRYANNGGIKVVGSNNLIDEVLIEDVGWLGTLDFPPIELGFGDASPTLRGSSPRLAIPGGVTRGNDNTVRRATVRRTGSMGVLTSQRSNRITLSHVYKCGLVGLDSAGLHADNSFTSCMNYSLPPSLRANCTKRWDHNWVHDCREKCVRGDDRNLNLTVDHNVVFNCGQPLFDRNDEPGRYPVGQGAASGVILKGDYNRFFANTVFNTSEYGQGDLCAVTSPLHSGFNLSQQNRHSAFYSSVSKRITGQAGPVPGPGLFTVWKDILELNQSEMKLRDPENFDFRPSEDSPLVMHKAGAYLPEEPYWRPGCTFSPSC